MNEELFEHLEFNEFQDSLEKVLNEPFEIKRGSGLTEFTMQEKEEFYELLTTIPFIKNLTSPDRRRAKDMPKDKHGRVVVDFANPHILEDMDYFRQAAIFYEKNGCYTMLRPNSNPNSEYRRFWTEEKRRCREGLVRESDGEWVTGLMYFYLNYCPILINVLVEGSERQANRIEGFPRVWEGAYLRFHYYHTARTNGEHVIELSRRGCGKSLSLACVAAHHFILGENSEVIKRVKTFVVAASKQFLNHSKDGTMSKFVPMIEFIFNNTPFPRLMLKDTADKGEWEMGYLDEFGRRNGSGNTVTTVAVGDEPDKVRGKRGTILFEEIGAFKNLREVYTNCRDSLEDGNAVFGMAILVGTANEKESDFKAAKKLMYNASANNFHAIQNVFDKPNQGKSEFGFFFGAYLNRFGCYDENGVSNVTKALREILIKRKIARTSSDPKTALKVIAEQPITPAEAMIKVKAAYFPVANLSERLLELDSGTELDDIAVGNLRVDSNGNVVFTPSNNDEPIRDFPVKNDTPGAIEIFSFPEKNANGKVFPGRYIVSHDPADNDVAESSSLTSTFVFDLFTDRIVAEFTGRKPFAEDNYEIVRLLALFYNAQILYEANKKGLFMYFSKLNCVSMLMDTPEHLKDKGLIKYSTYGNTSKGVTVNAAINSYTNQLIKDWLNRESTSIVNIDGDEREISVKNLYSIKSRALLQELIAYRPDIGNYDRIRSFAMIMLAREEQIIVYGDTFGKQEDEQEVYTDPFLERNKPYKING